MVKDGDELEKFRLKFSRCTRRDVAHLTNTKLTMKEYSTGCIIEVFSSV